MENVLDSLQQLFPYKSYSFKTSDCHKISFFNDEGLKLVHCGTVNMCFPFLAFEVGHMMVKLQSVF